MVFAADSDAIITKGIIALLINVYNGEKPETIVKEDLYFIENVLEKKDNLIIITEDEPNDSILSKVKYLYDHDGIFVIIHNIKRLQYNMLEHSLVPKCDVLTNQEKADFMNEYNVNNPVLQLPEISRFDPQALVMCIRPGEIAKFTRESITSLEADYYRICI